MFKTTSSKRLNSFRASSIPIFGGDEVAKETTQAMQALAMS